MQQPVCPVSGFEEGLKNIESSRRLLEWASRRGCHAALTRVEVDFVRQLWERVPKRFSNCPITDLTHVLLVDGVNGHFRGPVAIDRGGQED